MSQNNSQKIKFQAYANNQGRGHTEFGQGYHQGPYGYTTQALSVASNSGHDINKPVATAQQGMYSNAGMPAQAQHHQSMGGPIASPQPIIQQGQQLSRNQITMQTENDKLKRSVQGVLNELTPQKFVTVLSQLKGLNIDTEEKLALVIDLIYEKAIDETNFIVPYANLCKHLALIKVPVSGTSGTQVNFRKLLLAKCRKEFEQDRSDELKNEEKMKTLEAAEPDKRKELQLEYEEEEKKIRCRPLGNIRFIGELFKLGMLIEPIMHECIKKLISQSDEESLECLCMLLKTIGKELDDTKATQNSRNTNHMDMYFGQMKLIVDKRLTSSRVRLMLQDVIDLKKNNWVPRRDENNPKTIDQIHKEAEREAREQQQVYQNIPNYPKRISDVGDRRKNTGHSEFGPGYHQAPYGYTTQALSVASNSGHDINKPVATAQKGMCSNAGMPAPAQHHQSTGGPIASPQPIIQQGQQLSRNQITMQPAAYYPRNSVPPRSMQSMARNQIGAVVNQAGQQPSSQYGPMPTMVPLQPNFTSFPPAMVNPQFPQMYQQRTYNPPQYQPIMASQQYVWNTYNTPPPQNSNGSHGMSSYQSMPPQMPPQSIPAPPPQQHSRKGANAIPIIDPKTGKNVLSADKSAEDSSSRPNSEKESENSDSSICVQFATQVAAVLNDSRSEIPAKQPEPMRIETMCSHENEGIRLSETPVRELVDENVNELQNIENLSEVEYTDSRNLMCNDEISGTYYNKDIDAKSIIQSESVATKTVGLEINAEDREQNICEVPVESSVPDTEEPPKSEKLNSNSNTEKMVGYNESKKINNVKSVIELDCTDSTQELVQPVITGVKELSIPSNNEVLESSAVSPKNPEKVLNEGKKNKTKKKKDLNKRGESKEGGEMDAFLDVKEGAAMSPVPPPTPATAAPTSVPTVSERNPSPVPILDSEILNAIPLPGENPDPTPQNDISPSEPTSETSSVSPSADSEDKENVVDPTQNKLLLRYSYKEDQWSPLNPEGKKQYDRDFLLQLQSQPMSLCKPNNLPNLDVIKDKAHIQKLTEVNRAPPPVMNNAMRGYDPFMPGYARGGPMPRMPHAPVNRRSQGRGGEKPRKVISFTSSLNQNIKLHESQNAWKPLHKAEINQDEKDKLKRSVQGVLNKLTPQKFETLLSQLKGLNIDTEEKLALVIDLIFEKAIDEPNFSVPYANLCKHLALIKVPVSGTSGTQVNFRKLLLTKCQKEFEQDRSDELKNEEKMKTLEAAEPDKRKELQLEYEEEEKKIRYRQLGNIRFIGELFKLGMLIEPIMHECIKKLISQGDEESLECLCRLLKTIGKELDDTKATKNSRDTSHMDMYFGQMKMIVDKRLTSSRVRFMLQDVIDLKKNNWVPRRDENNPKTIDQIHKEAEREAREQQQVYQNIPNYPKRISDDRDRRKNTGRMGLSEDGWTSSSKGKMNYPVAVDPTKLKLTKPDEVESIRLGPGGRGLQSWGRGSSGGTKAAETDKTALTNRFSALSEQSLSANYEGRRGSQRSAASSRESSRGRNSQLPPAIRKTPSTSKERENLLETVKGLTRTSEAKAPEAKATTDVHVNGKTVTTEELVLNGPEYNEEDMEKKTKPLIDEFLHNNDFEEAIKCVTELASPNTVHVFINAAINQVLERSSQARYSLGQLLASLLKKKIMTFDQYKKGFAGVLEIIDDYALDIPLIWDYMGEILEPMIEDIETPFQLLKEVLQPCIPSEKAGMLVSSILHCAGKRKGTIKLGEVWRESGVLWTDIIGTDKSVSEFIEKHKLEFTVSPTKINPQTQMSMEEMQKHILSLLEKNAELEEVFDWVDANVSDTSGPTFVRALVTAVHESCLSGSGTTWELNTSKLKSRIPLISRYVSTNEKLQLQALYAVQALMNQLGQPGGLLHQIFDVLYDDDVIVEESFKEWEQSDDPNEAEGKGVAVHSVKSFFTWLREPEEENDEMNSV